MPLSSNDENNEVESVWDMNDDEVMAQDFGEFIGKTEDENESVESDSEENDEDVDESDSETTQQSEQIENETSESSEDDSESDEEIDGEDNQDTEEVKTDNGDSEKLAAIMAPLKANGKDFEIKDVDEVRKLMSMGIGFNKKMSQLKGHRQTLATLEKANISNDDLNFLIDLKNKKPEAISKLIKEAEYDPLAQDESNDTYVPSDHSVSDAQLAFDEAVEQLSSTESGQRTLDVIGNHMDDASRNSLANNPAQMYVIQQQIESGIFDKVNAELERWKQFGDPRIKGLSDIQAYGTVGSDMESKGAFTESNTSKSQGKPSANQTVTGNKKVAKQKKAAASPRQKSAVKPATKDVNYLSMSDEDFEKMFDSKYI